MGEVQEDAVDGGEAGFDGFKKERDCGRKSDG